jgi:hypothetical protein
MVNEIELHINTFKDTYNEFQTFLNVSLNEVINKSELTEYLNYVQNTNELFNTYISELNSENSIHLYGLIRGICRYYSEFNWFDDYGFHTKAQYFKNKLSEESQFIYNFFQTESPI